MLKVFQKNNSMESLFFNYFRSKISNLEYEPKNKRQDFKSEI